MVILIILGLLALIALLVVGKYNGLVRLKNLVGEALSGIDVQLKRRYDLIPNLVATVKGYSKHEKDTFGQIAELRSASINATTVQEKAAADVGLTQALKTLFAVSEAYPELKANTNFLELQRELTQIEDELQLSRRYYNGVVREYNTSISTFPGNLVAQAFSFQKYPYFELSTEVERETPKVEF